MTVIAVFYSFHFELDASGESLILENDESLKYYRKIRQQYGTDEFLVITYTPYEHLLSETSLSGIRYLRDKITKLENVRKVNTILDVPVVYTSGVQLSELGNQPRTIDSGQVTHEQAMDEFQNNPYYRNLLVSSDTKTTALQIIFHTDEYFYDLVNRRNTLLEKNVLTRAEKEDLDEIKTAINAHNRKILLRQQQDVEYIRELMTAVQDRARTHLGGIPMITADMIRFIQHDLIIFGTGVILFLVLIITLFFRTVQWVLLPLICCTVTGILMLGFLGLSGWRVTVISSNFLSLLLIITLSLTIHLIVRFRDLQLASPKMNHRDLIRETTASMVQPCFYTILTTIVAFASLLVSGIRPVIDFGWIMIIGLTFAFITCFTLFPALLALLPQPDKPAARDFTRSFMQGTARTVNQFPMTLIIIILVISAIAGYGIQKLRVENRFIDNFKASTEIFQGMKIIDQQLGGTTPLDVVIDPDKAFYETKAELEATSDELDEIFAMSSANEIEPNYWLNPDKLDKIRQVHAKLEGYPITGKVLSIGTAVEIAEHLNNAPLEEFELALIHKRTPETIRDDLIDPYLSSDANQVRFSIRVSETDPSLNRKELLGDIHTFLIETMNFSEDQVHLSGMLVLYNNMLQSLFRSQILTIGAVFIAIFLTFIILFRNLHLAVIAIIPNMVPTILILGLMGWAGIPLDMMTITIAAITIGISVDDTIHYVHRLKREFVQDNVHAQVIERCHTSVGKAMFYTSMAIIFGFSILAFSNFIPTIYFGLLTGFAMLVAIIADLLLLPAIVLIFRPDLGKKPGR